MSVVVKKPVKPNVRPTCDILFGEGYDVVCPNCRESYHETTEKFTEERPANGTMFRLQRPFGPLGANWSTFPDDAAVMCEALECPGCGASYTSGGTRVLVRRHRSSIVEDDMVRRDEFMEKATHGGKITAEEIFSEANAADLADTLNKIAPLSEELEHDGSEILDELRVPEDDLPDPESDGDELEDGTSCDPATTSDTETKPE